MQIFNFSKEKPLKFWELGAILGASLGIPTMIIGGQVSKEYGAGTAILSILMGNLVLWLIGLGIISMSGQHANIIETVKERLGKITSVIAGALWIIAFLVWYTVQIGSATEALNCLFSPIVQRDLIIWMGAVLGLSIAVISLGGLKLLKWMSLSALPLLIGFMFFAIISSKKASLFPGTWGFSFYATISIILIWLPGTIGLPAFFRHARSRADMMLALGLIMLGRMFFQISTVLIGTVTPQDILFGIGVYLPMAIIFVMISYSCINLVNIYYAAGGWASILKRKPSSSELALTGFFGTMLYVLLYSSSTWLRSPMESLQTFIAVLIADLGVVLLVSYLISSVVKHRIRPLEKLLSSLTWLVGCITALVFQFGFGKEIHASLIASVSAIVLCFLLILFVEEAIWSVKNR